MLLKIMDIRDKTDELEKLIKDRGMTEKEQLAFLALYRRGVDSQAILIMKLIEWMEIAEKRGENPPF